MSPSRRATLRIGRSVDQPDLHAEPHATLSSRTPSTRRLAVGNDEAPGHGRRRHHHQRHSDGQSEQHHLAGRHRDREHRPDGADAERSAVGGRHQRDGFYGADETATITFSCSDISPSGLAVSGVARCELLDGANVVGSTTSGAATNYPIPDGRSGTKSFTVRADRQRQQHIRTTAPQRSASTGLHPPLPRSSSTPAGLDQRGHRQRDHHRNRHRRVRHQVDHHELHAAVCTVPVPATFIDPATGTATLQLIHRPASPRITATATDRANNTSLAATIARHRPDAADRIVEQRAAGPHQRGVDSIDVLVR